MITPITQEALYAEWQRHIESAVPDGHGMTTAEVQAMLNEGRDTIPKSSVDRFLKAMIAVGRVRVSRKRVPTRIGRLTTVPSYIFVAEDKPEPKGKKRGTT